ncbi:MAG: M4 family metallopeptidase [Actinomycetota bacterium]|nr:M4 family metallopeptidase [Actinomycetota bacterium]
MKSPSRRTLAYPAIVPPHILENIARFGTPSQRHRASQTLTHDASLRATRAGALVVHPSVVSEPVVSRVAGRPERTIYDAGHTDRLPGVIVRTERGHSTSDPEVEEAFSGLGATYDFYWKVFERDSIDGRGLPLLAVVHYQSDYDNAFWDGTQMIFGDGDGRLFNRFTSSLDIIGHELTHGVTEVEASLLYKAQSGALNESISDLFGSLVKQFALGQSASEADWLIGTGAFTKNVNARAIRSMAAPGTAYDDPVIGKDPQPADMSGYVRTAKDNGGVHINSGIPNRAFYETAINIGGFAWERSGRIWYEALLSSRLRPGTKFKGFASITAQTARLLFGKGREEQAVVQAWSKVGISI